MKYNKRYQIIDTQTNAIVASYNSFKAARRKADQRDLEYGAYRYFIRLNGLRRPAFIGVMANENR